MKSGHLKFEILNLKQIRNLKSQCTKALKHWKIGFSDLFRISCFGFVLCLMTPAFSAMASAPVVGQEAAPGATVVEYDAKDFRSDPTYQDKPYEAEKQLAIYGGKHANPTARPLLELGRELYTSGPFRQGINLVGKKNLLFPHAMAYGD